MLTEKVNELFVSQLSEWELAKTNYEQLRSVKTKRIGFGRDLPFNGSYTILVNPFPIFRRHLTITRNEHTDQRIRNSFSDMLTLERELDGFSVFYNGPQCGASAPDHLHFQAGERGFMLLEKDFQAGRHAKIFSVISGIEIW